MSSLLLWAIVWDIVGRSGASFIIAAALARSLLVSSRSYPPPTFCVALRITFQAFFLHNFIVLCIGVPLCFLICLSLSCLPLFPALFQLVPFRASLLLFYLSSCRCSALFQTTILLTVLLFSICIFFLYSLSFFSVTSRLLFCIWRLASLPTSFSPSPISSSGCLS